MKTDAPNDWKGRGNMMLGRRTLLQSAAGLAAAAAVRIGLLSLTGVTVTTIACESTNVPSLTLTVTL